MSGDSNQDDSVLRDILAPVYIVVMCCGLAGAIVLFLVFATMPHAGQGQSQQWAVPQSLGRDLSSAAVGARMTERAQFGLHDVMQIRLDLDTSEIAIDAVEFPQMAGMKKFLEANSAPTGRGRQFWSPLVVQKRQTRPIEVVLKERPTTPLKCSGRLLIVAGGQSTGELPITVDIPAASAGSLERFVIGTVNVNDRRGPTEWFQHAPGVTVSRNTP